jgi:uncharacterized membrane protein
MTVDPIVHWSFVSLIGIALLLFSFWTYPKGVRGRRLLLILRTLAILVLLFIMFRPSIIYTHQEQLSSTLLMLVDESRSMQLADETAGRTRWEAVTKDLTDSQVPIERLQEKVNIRWFGFGSSLAEASKQAIVDAKPIEERTAIGDGLDQARRQLAGERVAGVILFSDGTNTAGISPAQVAKQFRSTKTPIHTFGYGQEVVSEQARDLIARSIRTNPTVFAKNRLPVTGEFDIAGFANQPISIRLLFNDVEQAKGEFRSPAEASRLLADLQAVPTIPGDLKVTLEASATGDRQTSNNSVSTWVTVLSGGISVLEIEGKYRFWEPKYVRWALDQSADIELSQIFLLNEGGNRATLPDELIQPGRFDVIILGDISSSQLSPEQITKIASLVKDRGTGFMMMGGYDSFGPGGWGTSPLAGVLPVDVQPGDGQLQGQLPMIPTDIGLRHFIMRLANTPEANLAIWKQLKPLDGASRWSGLKPAAQLLATSNNKLPMLAAQTVGAGRSIAFAGDTTWRWRKDKTGIGYHARFWRQLILWLAKKEDSGSPSLKVSLPTRRLSLGQSLPISIHAHEADGAPITKATVTASVETPDGKKVPLEIFQQGESFQGTFWQTDAVGDFTLEVTGKSGDRDLGTTKVKFLVFSEDAESQQPAADLTLLQNIAKTTGGEFHRHLELADFLQSLDKKDLNLEVSQPIVVTLWDRWEVLTLFLVLMTIEWVARKRFGMI